MKKALPFFLPPFLLISMSISVYSCGKAAESRMGTASMPANAIPSLPDPGVEAVPNRAAIMVNGNHWILGVPGFGVNAFSALAGSYRLLGTDPGSGSVPAGGNAGSDIGSDADKGNGCNFSVYVTGELLYFSGGWQQAARGAMRAYEKNGEEGFMEAVVLEDHKGIFRTAIFQFPQGLEGSGFDAASLNQMLPAWTNKILYFISQANADTEISLPAVVEF